MALGRAGTPFFWNRSRLLASREWRDLFPATDTSCRPGQQSRRSQPPRRWDSRCLVSSRPRRRPGLGQSLLPARPKGGGRTQDPRAAPNLCDRPHGYDLRRVAQDQESQVLVDFPTRFTRSPRLISFPLHYQLRPREASEVDLCRGSDRLILRPVRRRSDSHRWFLRRLRQDHKEALAISHL